jgi:wobble nucleotide-excising tRNase
MLKGSISVFIEETQSEVKDKIVVIDDPISSLSHIYVFNVAELLKEHFIGKNAKFLQCFVLTHNLYFFNELISQTKGNSKHIKLFRISKNENSQISEIESNEVQNDYQSYWLIIKNKNENDKFMVANAMRNIIEYFFGYEDRLKDYV